MTPTTHRSSLLETRREVAEACPELASLPPDLDRIVADCTREVYRLTGRWVSTSDVLGDLAAARAMLESEATR